MDGWIDGSPGLQGWMGQGRPSPLLSVTLPICHYDCYSFIYISCPLNHKLQSVGQFITVDYCQSNSSSAKGIGCHLEHSHTDLLGIMTDVLLIWISSLSDSSSNLSVYTVYTSVHWHWLKFISEWLYSLSVCLHVCPLTGYHPEDSRHPQGEVCFLSGPASQPPALREHPLAAPRHGGVPRQGEVRAAPPSGRVEVRTRTETYCMKLYLHCWSLVPVLSVCAVWPTPIVIVALAKQHKLIWEQAT